MRRSITVAYKLGDRVVLTSDPEIIRVVTGYIVRTRSIVYGVSDAEGESWHQAIEIEPTQKSHKVRGFKG